MLALILSAQLLQAGAAAPPPIAVPAAATPAGVDGRGSPTVRIPRIEAAIVVDGQLDEPPWSQAARLTGFSQYQPVDGRPAEERTEVLVWYSPSALHIGILAYDREAATIRATIADRDNLDREDTVTVFLDTFNDRRRAFFFTVNPLGSQQDGVQSEGAFNAGTMYGGTIDKNPDYLWDSKGRVTPEGYVVEIRIPFKSLRYPGGGPMKWGINVQRKVQRTGYVDTWTDVRRASSSFLTQAGAIDGLHDLHRGVVTEVQPFVTAASNGVAITDGTYSRDKTDVNPGVNLHLGFTSASVDGTVNPDFSQVESDVGQVTLNQRFALFYAEKRPFFLEGIELFSTPNQLVYTRQIAEPIAGAKVTGKFGPLNVAYLSVKDKADAGGDFFNIARVRRDIGQSSTVGVTVTDRSRSGAFNRVVAADSRIVFAKLYYVQGQIGGSWTGAAGETKAAPIWLAEFDRTGRAWGFNYKLTGIGTDFLAGSGYVPRNDIVEFHGSNRFSWYGARGAFIEQFTTFFGPGFIWRYADFPSMTAIEGSQEVNLMFSLRGGWNVHAGFNRNFVDFDPRDYRGYEVEGPDGLVPFGVPHGLSGLVGTGVTVSTPTYKTFNASVELQRQGVPIFPEASEGRETLVAGTIGARPTESIRIDGSLTWSRILRAPGGDEFAQTVLPRLKVEYQPTRALFFRVVGEYRSQRQAALLDPATGGPIYRVGVPIPADSLNGLRVDFLLSYEPTPGTVVFVGYGSSLATTRMLSLADLHRQSDGFFVKLAYLFRR